jgi:mannose-6-phosphate isomerase-like protein (cupin superfamily)
MEILKQAGAFRTPPAGATREYVEHLRVPAMSVGTYSIPAGGIDTQSPHHEDEIYVVTAGRARFTSDTGEAEVGPGDVIFVPAGETHRFVDIAGDFATLVFFAPAETE